MSEEIDTTNRFMVGLRMNGNIVVQRPPIQQMTKAEALNLAAYIVAMADPGGKEFERVLKAVKST